MIKKRVYYTFFILLAYILICIGIIAIMTITICLSYHFTYGYLRDNVYFVITYGSILGVDFLFMFILYSIFKKTRKKLKKEHAIRIKDKLLSKQ